MRIKSKHLANLLAPTWISSVLFSTSLSAALVALDDDGLSDVNGQAGVTVVVEQAATQSGISGDPAPQATQIERIEWQTADETQGGSLVMERVGIGQVDGGPSTLSTEITVDVSASDGLQLGIEQGPRRIGVGEFSLGSTYDASSPDYQKTFGSLIVDYSLNGNVGILAAPGGGMRLSGMLNIVDLDFTYNDLTAGYNGPGTRQPANRLAIYGVDVGLDTTSGYLDVTVANTAGGDVIRLNANQVLTSLSVDGVTTNNLTAVRADENFFGLSGLFDLTGSVDIGALPGSGTGVSIAPVLYSNCETTECLAPAVTDGSRYLRLVDDNVEIGMANFYGRLLAPQGIQLSVNSGATGEYVQVFTPELDLRFGMNDIFINSLNLVGVGDSTNSESLGELYGNLLFNSDNALTGETDYHNTLQLFPGGARGNSGVRAQIQSNLNSGDIRYADDGRYVWFAGLSAYGQGEFIFDMVQGQPRPGDTLYNRNLGYGIRLGFNNISGGYRMQGLYVTTDPDATPDYTALQGGTEALYLTGLYQAMNFGDLNGVILLTPGGARGSDGLSFQTDYTISDAQGGLLLTYYREDENGNNICGNGCGIWSDDMNWETHYRNGSVDLIAQHPFQFLGSNGNIVTVNRNAIAMSFNRYGFRQINNLTLANADSLNSQTSFGRLLLEEHQNIDMIVSTGGDPNRGNQGLTIFLKNEFLPKGSAGPEGSSDYAVDADIPGSTNGRAEKQNRIRVAEQTDPDDLFIEVSDIRTDSFGIQNTLNIDVATVASGTDTGFAVNLLTEAQEIRTGNIHVGSNPLVQEAAIFNLRMQSNVVATPFSN